jgi:hypothetical protein
VESKISKIKKKKKDRSVQGEKYCLPKMLLLNFRGGVSCDWWWGGLMDVGVV